MKGLIYIYSNYSLFSIFFLILFRISLKIDTQKQTKSKIQSFISDATRSALKFLNPPPLFKENDKKQQQKRKKKKEALSPIFQQKKIWKLKN